MTLPKPISRDEARSAGLKRFFTAIACFRGHECERLVSSGCCIECSRLTKAADKARNPERERARRRKYHHANPERVKAWRESTEVKKYGKLLPKRAKSKARPLDQRRAARLADSRTWYQKNKEAELKRAADRDRLKPEGRRVRDRNRRARKKSADGRHTADDVKALFKRQGGKCAACLERVTFAKKHVDHIVPLARGGSNWPANLQILCKPCNLRKSWKCPIEWARYNGLLL